MSDTEDVNSNSLRFVQSRYMGSYRCVKNTNTSQQLLEMARVKGLALMQWEERHSATNQVKVEDNKNQVGRVVSWLVSLIGWAPDLCSRYVVMKFDLQGGP